MAYQLKILDKLYGVKAHQIEGDILWASAGYSVYAINLEHDITEKTGRVRTNIINSFLSRLAVFKRLARLDIHNLYVLRSGTILTFADSCIFRSTDNGNNFIRVHSFPKRTKPLPSGVCEDGSGQAYYGEYFLNSERKDEVGIYRSGDDGLTWKLVYSFPPGKIRHVHAVQYDAFSDSVWVTTGDEDEECSIGYSKNSLETLEIISSGSQEWRAVSLMFTDKHVWWGTDTQRIQSSFCRWDRHSRKMSKICPVDGPVYYSSVLGDNIMIAATTVEGGEREWDDRAHLWLYNKKDGWKSLQSWKKDRLPKLFQFGTIHIAKGQTNTGKFCITLRALESTDDVILVCQLVEK